MTRESNQWGVRSLHDLRDAISAVRAQLPHPGLGLRASLVSTRWQYSSSYSAWAWPARLVTR